jgi:hypothetical protein
MIPNEVKQYQKSLLSLPNVNGIAYGYGQTGGEDHYAPSILVLVEKKIPLSQLKSRDVIPSGLNGIPTDVLQVGKIVAQKARTDTWRPAPPGVSLGHYNVTAGTFGAVVTDNISGSRVILSNNHVLANSNNANIGDKIIQPGSYDGGCEKIAELKRFVKIEMTGGSGGDTDTCPFANGVAKIINVVAKVLRSKFRLVPQRVKQSTVNRVDAAIALPIYSGLITEEIIDVGVLTGWTNAKLGMEVTKSGRTTGTTYGSITALGATVTVSYGDGRSATFEDQILTTNMSQGGDSGSVLVERNTTRAVGLLFAGSDTVTVHNPFELVMQELNISV